MSQAPRSESICVLANPGSGRNSRDRQAVEAAVAELGPSARLYRWGRHENLQEVVRRLVGDGHGTIVAAGGDGTVMGIAQALVKTPARLAVLPLGTFNYFARGLGLPEDPAAAAAAIPGGRTHRISVGCVNGQVFLNNASVGVYPTILRAREGIYRRFGRSRLLAYWSVLRTLARFQRPMRLTLTADGETRQVRTPLVFVARSAFQLEQLGLSGAEAISDDRFAVFLVRGGTRADLFRTALRLVLRRVEVGRDVDLLGARTLTIRSDKRRLLVAFDGEKGRLDVPLEFTIEEDALAIVAPAIARDAAA